MTITCTIIDRTVTFDVSPGWHIFKWIYIKDFSNTVVPDLAKIYEIGYNGTEYAMSQCQPCRSQPQRSQAPEKHSSATASGS